MRFCPPASQRELRRSRSSFTNEDMPTPQIFAGTYQLARFVGERRRRSRFTGFSCRTFIKVNGTNSTRANPSRRLPSTTGNWVANDGSRCIDQHGWALTTDGRLIMRESPIVSLAGIPMVGTWLPIVGRSGMTTRSIVMNQSRLSFA